MRSGRLRILSRWMPSLRPDRYPPPTIVGWIVLVLLAGLTMVGLGSCAWMCVLVIVAAPVFATLIALVIGVLIAHGIRSANRAERAIAEERQGEDIGSFARALDRRSEPFDPWVVRAVWDAFSPYAGSIPLRATDRLEDFGIELLELDLLIEEVAERSGHSLKDLHKFWVQDATLGDLVVFVSDQPKRPTGS